MADKISTLISQELNIPLNQVSSTVSLLRDDNSIPFISRYRAEVTAHLEERHIRSIDARMAYYDELQKRKNTILKTIESQEQLTEELSNRILNCWDATELEDIYLPYKPKRRTRAQMAREKGLEPLAKMIMAQKGGNVNQMATKFVDGEKVPNTDEAIDGALDIIAEWVNENQAVRNSVRRSFRYDAVLNCSVVKGKEIEGRNYEFYYDFSKPLKYISSHQLLAIRRGETEGFLKVSIDLNNDRAADNVCRLAVRGNGEP